MLVVFALAAAIATAQSKNSGIQTFDIVVVNGRVMDPESGLDAIRNIGISGDSIKIITTEKIAGRTTIDAKNLVVAPGFIDLHQHDHEPSDYALKVRMESRAPSSSKPVLRMWMAGTPNVRAKL
jgi:predicted amidohydrolase